MASFRKRGESWEATVRKRGVHQSATLIGIGCQPDTIVTELVRSLPRRDRDFILSYVQAFAAHQMERGG